MSPLATPIWSLFLSICSLYTLLAGQEIAMGSMRCVLCSGRKWTLQITAIVKIGFVSSGVLLGLSAGALRSVLFGLNYELQSVGIWGHMAGAEGPERSVVEGVWWGWSWEAGAERFAGKGF